MTPLVTLYAHRADAGDIIHDPAQERAAAHLDAFVARWTRRGARGLLRRKKQAVKGLYLYGGVGRGKTMLMDMLAAHLAGPHVRRVHFHAFMLEIHARLKSLRDRGGEVDDFIGAVAADIARETELLCFDELHVNDIADAMILGPLFAALFRLGVGVIATSNYAPDDLYRDGLQRARFVPFIAELKKHMDVVHLQSPTDYRLRALSEQGTWFHPLTDDSWTRMNALFETLTDQQPTAPGAIDIDGRSLPFLRAGAHCAWLDFETLCRQPRGAADYLALSHAFGTVFVDDVPRLSEETRNEARRFMTLVDTLYDQGRVLVARAAADPAHLYSGDTHGFEFQRTVSRLLEMQSPEWLARAGAARLAP